MCLNTRKGTPEKTEGIGWKVFSQTHKGATLHSQMFDGHLVRPRRTWIKAATNAEGMGWYRQGEEGFHIYANREDAAASLSDTVFSHSVLRKVRYRGAFQIGSGDGRWNGGNRVVVVAKEMYIMEANRS